MKSGRRLSSIIPFDRGITGFSFFAQAYTWNGKTVISYRGTDNIPVDAATGWITGGGAYRGPQAQMAADFYKAIINSASPDSPNIEFTGQFRWAAASPR